MISMLIILYLLSGISWGFWAVHFNLYFNPEIIEVYIHEPKEVQWIYKSVAVVIIMIITAITWPVEIPHVLYGIVSKKKSK